MLRMRHWKLNEIETKLRNHLGLLPPDPIDKTPPAADAGASAHEKEKAAAEKARR